MRQSKGPLGCTVPGTLLVTAGGCSVWNRIDVGASDIVLFQPLLSFSGSGSASAESKEPAAALQSRQPAFLQGRASLRSWFVTVGR